METKSTKSPVIPTAAANHSKAVSQRKIRWGILGYAQIARKAVMLAIQRSSNSELYALASRQESKLAECRAQFTMPALYADYGKLLQDPAIDAVYNPLPNSLHREWTIRAAENGKHVLCEKPLALNPAEWREMTAACAANNVLLMEAFMYRYNERTRKVLEIVREGVLGEIKFIGSSFRFLLEDKLAFNLKPELGGGSLYDVGCYPINFTGMILDQVTGAQPGETRPESVFARCVMQGGVDMICSALLKYPSGVIASLNCGFNSQSQTYSEIIGTRGALEIPDTFFGHPGAMTLKVGEESRQITLPESDSYRLEVEDFADAILKKRAPFLSMAETHRNMEVLERIRAAAK